MPANEFRPSALSTVHDDVELLVDTLGADYGTLLSRLSRALRSHDKAAEALHVAYVGLGQGPAIGRVRNPISYLYTMALNLAENIRRRDLRLVSVPPEILSDLIDAARWIFLSGLSVTGDYLEAVGVYHSPATWRQRRYALSVAAKLEKRFGSHLFSGRTAR